MKVLENLLNYVHEAESTYPEDRAVIAARLDDFYQKISSYAQQHQENGKSLEAVLAELDRVRSLKDPLKFHIELYT